MTPDQARRCVRTAVENGTLTRPDRCSRCDAPDTKATSGRHTIQGHHHDYSRPLEVEWICPACHRAETPLSSLPPPVVSGERNGCAKLTWKQVEEIRASDLGARKLGRLYGTDKANIRRIRQGRAWAASPTPQEAGREG